MNNKQFIEEKIDEIFEPIEDDKCENCQTNFSVVKIEIKDFISQVLQQALAERDREMMEMIKAMKLKYELSQNNKIFNLSIDEVLKALTPRE